jgi:hypothetical protein|tara:strand:- start:652 stop:996 length:345 start_codon:yes stop_codon:yes gene_type:complete
MIKTINFYKDNFEAIIYNISSIFFIITNLFIPLYTDEIIYFNSNIIEKITLNYKIDNKKKELFLNFTDNLIEKNKDIITKIENERIKNENIDNYTLDAYNIDNEYSDDDSLEND